MDTILIRSDKIWSDLEDLIDYMTEEGLDINKKTRYVYEQIEKLTRESKRLNTDIREETLKTS